MTPNHTLIADLPRRPFFRDGQVLRAGDLRGDDAERTRAERRHAGMVHTPGLVAGLWLSAEEEDTNVTVSPGMAIDGAGRSILVGRSRSVPISDPTAEYEVWIAHVETPADADSTRVPLAPPDRYTETSRVLFSPLGTYDPADPSAHPEHAVSLGVVLKQISTYRGAGLAPPAPVAPATTRASAPGLGRTRNLAPAPLAETATEPLRVRHEGRLYVSVVG